MSPALLNSAEADSAGMALPRPKIAYLCDRSPLDRSSYSGGNARMRDALQRHVGEVHVLGQSWHRAEPVRRLVEALPDRLTIRMRWRAHLALSRIIAAGLRRELAQGQYDVLFAAYSFHALHNLRPPYPMLTVYTSDATPTVYRQSEIGASFRSFLPLSRLLDPLILRAEKRVFGSADLLLWPTEWLKTGADRTYGLTDATSRVISWGANIRPPAAETEGPALARGRPLHLLLIGRDWFAKGGPVAVDVMQEMRRRGVDARLTVIGCVPPPFHMSDHVTVHPHLDKSVPAELAVFTGALRAAHFMVMPSFESFGFAFCEASAYSLPSLCLRIGGVPVRDGVNGYALPRQSDAGAFADVLEYYLDHPGEYAALRITTRREYDENLNWDAWGMAVAQAIAAARHGSAGPAAPGQ